MKGEKTAGEEQGMTAVNPNRHRRQNLTVHTRVLERSHKKQVPPKEVKKILRHGQGEKIAGEEPVLGVEVIATMKTQGSKANMT